MNRRDIFKGAAVVTLIPVAQQKADAMAEVWAYLRTSDQRSLTPEENKRLREAEARANRRFG